MSDQAPEMTRLGIKLNQRRGCFTLTNFAKVHVKYLSR